MNPRSMRTCAAFLCAQLLVVNEALAEVSSIHGDTLTVGGPAGGLLVPDGRVLAEGTAMLGFNNFVEPRFAKADRAANYLFALGFLPLVEISGRLANYPTTSNSRGYLARDLSANVKVEVPRFFQFQPDIAVGINDLGGGASLMQSKYAVASQSFGELRVRLGVARGDASLNSWLGGAELALGQSGVSVLAELSNHVTTAGARYQSAALANLANARVNVTVQRAFGAAASGGGKAAGTTVGVSLAIPFGDNAGTVKLPKANHDAIWTVPAAYKNIAPGNAMLPSANEGAPLVSSVMPGKPAVDASTAGVPIAIAELRPLQAALEKAGLERIRLGLVGSKLVIEYENHRYNQNEVDAIGIVLGLAARLAPPPVVSLAAVTKKAGLMLYETRVDRNRFKRFLDDGDVYDARVGFDVVLRPAEDVGVQWLETSEGKRGYSRIVVEPLIKKFVGTEVGVLDYSLAAQVDAIAPVWKGAEISTSSIVHVADSENVRAGQVFNYASLRSGLQSATVSQSLWLTDQLLNVTTAGKFLYDHTGVQNETVLFVPGSEDQVRLEYTRLNYSVAQVKGTKVTMGVSYRWNYEPLNLWIEPAYNQYVNNDRGPSLTLGRWFGDIQAQAYFRRSDSTTFAGFRLVFPLTPRRGMGPGLTQVDGTSQFSFGLETKLVGQGNCNCIETGIAEEIPLVYSARNSLLNQGRVGKRYLSSQLLRMREAALLFAPFE